MPIKDKSKYAPNWKEIRKRILVRDNHKCKECGIENGAVGHRNSDGSFSYCPDYLRAKKMGAGFYITTGKLKIVLTIAHLDHNPENNEESNLATLCQYHHLKLDKEQHMKNARETRNRKKGLQELF